MSSCCGNRASETSVPSRSRRSDRPSDPSGTVGSATAALGHDPRTRPHYPRRHAVASLRGMGFGRQAVLEHASPTPVAQHGAGVRSTSGSRTCPRAPWQGRWPSPGVLTCPTLAQRAWCDRRPAGRPNRSGAGPRPGRSHAKYHTATDRPVFATSSGGCAYPAPGWVPRLATASISCHSRSARSRDVAVPFFTTTRLLTGSCDRSAVSELFHDL